MSNAQPVPPVTVIQPAASNPTTAGAVAQSNSGGGDMSSTISSLSDLKNKAPAVYKAMMQGIGMNICNEMKKHQDQLQELIDEYSRYG